MEGRCESNRRRDEVYPASFGDEEETGLKLDDDEDTQQTCLQRHELHACSSYQNFFRIIFYHRKQDWLLPVGYSICA